MTDRPYFRSTWRDLEADADADLTGVLEEIDIRCAPGRSPSRGLRKLRETLRSSPGLQEGAQDEAPF